ncbi:lysine--tRNA ligase [Chloroflexota bacterium]
MSRLERIVEQRLEKLEKLRSQGINPYPNRYHRTHNAQEASALFIKYEQEPEFLSNLELSLAGRITASRFMGKIAFMDVRDGSGKMQIFLTRDLFSDEKYQLLHDLDIGDIIGAVGKLFRTKTGEITLQATDITLLSKSLHPLPEKWHGLADVEKRYRQRYLDLLANEETRPVFMRRSQIITALRCFLNKQGFIEVETPVLQPMAGGALARPFITHHHTLDQDLYLRIALELYLKRLIVGGFDKVYEVGRVFRNEGISIKHNPEFTMMECYQAYADYIDMMKLVEEMVCFIVTEIAGGTEVSFGSDVIKLKTPWRRLTLREAIITFGNVDFEAYTDTESLREKMRQMGIDVDPHKDRGRLIDELVSTFVEPNLTQPTFLIDYPVEMSPLAKMKPGTANVVERFEAFIGGMEIANSFTELNDPLEQEKRFHHQLEGRTSIDDIEEVIDDDFLLALEYGMPPTGGLGVGIDRLVMLMTDKQSIREVILFPQLKGK